jgi:large subunit ribosomal protein L9
MEVILLERINRLGAVGDVVRVKDGFGRNFLIPGKKALRATETNKKVFEAKRAEIDALNAENRAAAEAVAKKIETVTVTLIRQSSEEGKLFGSVTVRDIAEELKLAGHNVPKSQIVISGTIKTTGTYPVKVQLHPEVTVTLNVNVVKNDQEGAA